MTNEVMAQLVEGVLREDRDCLTADEILALEAGAAALRALEWRPIESAPKDGTSILAFDSISGFMRVVARHGNKWALQGASNRDYPKNYFTHYLDLPAPPKEGV